MSDSQPFDLPLVEHPQQLDLDLGRQVTDFVEEDRRAVRKFETSGLARERSGERPLLAAEQLALDERAGDRGTVHADHRPSAPRAQFVNLRREEFLACAGLTEEQHR